MITTAFVHIWDRLVGAVAWDPTEQVASFEYTPEFIDQGWDLAPILMPRSSNRIFTFPELRPARDSAYDTFKGLPGLLADVLPDKYGHRLINAWLAQNGRPANSMNPVELLCFIGQRGMGALEFSPAHPHNTNTSFSLELSSLVHTAKNLLEQKENFKTKVKSDSEQPILDILKIGTSAGGARPKAIIAYHPETKEVRSGQTTPPPGFSQWLIKLDGVSDVQLGATHGYGRVEMAYYLMAKACGIEMMESQLLEENGRAHFMTKRYDRGPNGEKYHAQTFCALRHFDFNDVLSYSYEQLFETMRMLSLPYYEAEEMYRRMVFNVIARNCDDHTKNFAFLLKPKGEWSLSPAYDICYAYRPDSIWVSQHALSINGKRKNITRDDFLLVAKSMNIRRPKSIIEDVLHHINNWSFFAKAAGVDNRLEKHIQEHHIILN